MFYLTVFTLFFICTYFILRNLASFLNLQPVMGICVYLVFYLLAVVYLDADTIVVKNIEDLFKCGKFCANLKHSERLNSGVMVVEPSEELFKDMMSKVNTLPSYTGGTTSTYQSSTSNLFNELFWFLHS